MLGVSGWYAFYGKDILLLRDILIENTLQVKNWSLTNQLNGIGNDPNPKGAGVYLIFWPIFLENCLKRRNLEPDAPPPGSATVKAVLVFSLRRSFGADKNTWHGLFILILIKVFENVLWNILGFTNLWDKCSQERSIQVFLQLFMSLFGSLFE